MQVPPKVRQPTDVVIFCQRIDQPSVYLHSAYTYNLQV